MHGSKPSGNSFLGGALLGIQKYFYNDVYLALAGNALYNSYDTSIRLSTSATTGVTTMDVNLSNDFQYGLNVRLGKRFGTATPYLLAGVEAGKWDMTLTNASNVSARGLLANSSTTFGKTRSGFQAGLGTLVSLNDNWNFGIEYAHTWFGTISNNGSVPSQNYLHEAKIEQDQALFSLNYLFNV
ncbi:outer membrane protein [Legionella shakespearei]|uniref:outer membrane protein n=1 Tax=Legionella shakespearei TaxID=45075 RepID=UPI001ED9B0C0|nr:outer membrane beta-barrel protein [Legionella shakespearei]